MQIDDLTPEQLVALQHQITKRLADTRAERLTTLRADIEKRVLEAGFTLSDLYPVLTEKTAQRPSKRVLGGRGAVPVKYRSGDNEWTGRGKQPAWVKSHLAEGGTLEQIAA